MSDVNLRGSLSGVGDITGALDVYRFRLRMQALHYLHENEGPKIRGKGRSWLYLWRAHLDSLDAGADRSAWIDAAITDFARAQLAKPHGADVEQFARWDARLDAAIEVRVRAALPGGGLIAAMEAVARERGIPIGNLKRDDTLLNDCFRDIDL